MNNKINISNRIKAIGDFVVDNSKVVDIGCDHGLLSIYIYKTKKNIKVIASDINIKPLKSAIENIEKYGLKDKIETRISDGLKNVNSNEFDTIIISGLGGNTIISILKNDLDKTNNAQNIIIQANNNIDKVRKFLSTNKYKIVKETLVDENNIISTIILFEKNNKKIKYNKSEILFGPMLIIEKSELFKRQNEQELNKNIKIFNNIPKKYIIKRATLKKRIKSLRKHI